ncbi:MAG: hypothetical protein WCI78_16845, partial [Mycobacterium sp.]
TALTGLSAPDTAIRRAPGAGRYTLTETVTNTLPSSPTMIDTTRPHNAHTATLDEVLCVATD